MITVEHLSEAKVALQFAYRKHVLDDPGIGWEELSYILRDTLAEIMGDDKFVEWRENQETRLAGESQEGGVSHA